MNLTADSLKIDTDEGRFVLVVDTEEIGRMTVDIHALALEFEAEVRRELRPYALEAEHVRGTMTVFPAEQDDGYEPTDPKSPGYHERMVP